MSKVIPFEALLPDPKIAGEIISPPYDVIDSEAAGAYVAARPNSFLRVTKAEVDLPKNCPIAAQSVFEMACANFKLFMDEGLLKKTSESFYVYQQRIDDRVQTGLVAGVSVDEYQRGLIKKHELTRFEKVDERSKYAINVGAHLEPVMIVHRDNQSISELIYKATASDPLYDIIDTDGVRNILWRADNAREIQKEFGKLEALYIADGHHRSEAALIARNALQAENPKHNGSEKYNFYPAVIFAEKELKVYEYDWDGDPPKRPPSRYTIKDVMAYADRSETMPPKSTWFSPKLASGLFVYPLS